LGLVPDDEFPLLLPWVPAVAGFELEDPLFEDPVFGAEPDAPLAVPGIAPHGEPLGEVPGLFELFGFVVDGCVVFPLADGLVGFEPGALGFGVLGDEEPGLVCPGAVCGGVAPVGGFSAPVGGAVGEPGVELCPALLEPPAGRAPPAELWATAQLAQHNTTDSNVSFRDDMSKGLQALQIAPASQYRQPTDDLWELESLLTQGQYGRA